MNLSIELHPVTPPATEPVTLSEMREHLGITQSTDTSRDSIISRRIVCAREWAEEYTRTFFITQSILGSADDFHENIIYLKRPLQSVTTVKYIDETGIQQLISSSEYQVDTLSACILPKYGAEWPTARNQPNSVQIQFIVGYGNAAAVPESIKEAIRFIVSQWEVFQSSIEGVMRPFTIPNAAKQLLDGKVDQREYF